MSNCCLVLPRKWREASNVATGLWDGGLRMDLRAGMAGKGII